MPERGEVYLMTQRIRQKFPKGTILEKIVYLDNKGGSSKLDKMLIPVDHFPLTIRKTYSRGKKTIILFDNNMGLLVSYGMTASWRIFRNKPAVYQFIFLVKGKKVNYYWQAVRKFHCEYVMYDSRRKIAELARKNGYDIYKDNPTDQEIISSYPPRGTNICAFLRSNKFDGIGNYLCCVILYRLRLSPYKNTSELTNKQKIDIFYTGKKIVKEVIELGGHTVENFYLDDEKPLGEYDTTPYLPKLYRAGKSMTDKKGRKITRDIIGGRCTYWCPQLQK